MNPNKKLNVTYMGVGLNNFPTLEFLQEHKRHPNHPMSFLTTNNSL